MQELEKRIGLLRLLLADIHSKKAQLSELESQYRAQLVRIVEFVVYRDGDVANALSLMSEVQGKLNEVLQTAQHLGMIDEKTGAELEVLLLTKRVSEARSQLAELEAKQQELASKLSYLSDTSAEERHPASAETAPVSDMEHISDEVTNVAREIERLHHLITEASERAARSILGAASREHT